MLFHLLPSVKRAQIGSNHKIVRGFYIERRRNIRKERTNEMGDQEASISRKDLSPSNYNFTPTASAK